MKEAFELYNFLHEKDWDLSITLSSLLSIYLTIATQNGLNREEVMGASVDAIDKAFDIVEDTSGMTLQ